MVALCSYPSVMSHKVCPVQEKHLTTVNIVYLRKSMSYFSRQVMWTIMLICTALYRSSRCETDLAIRRVWWSIPSAAIYSMSLVVLLIIVVRVDSLLVACMRWCRTRGTDKIVLAPVHSDGRSAYNLQRIKFLSHLPHWAHVNERLRGKAWFYTGVWFICNDCHTKLAEKQMTKTLTR